MKPIAKKPPNLALVASAFAIIFTTFSLSPAHAQEQECQAALERAEDQYDVSDYSGVIRLLAPCASLIPEERRVRAYKLLALAYLKIDERNSAKANVKDLLELKPKFNPDPNQDPREFVDLVNEAKQERPKSKKWLWIGGGGVVAGAVAAYFIFKEEGVPDLPLPPNPPKQ
jgi:hypothetical protein